MTPRRAIDFTSNDYLGLAGSDELRAILAAGLKKDLPAGSGGSRLLRGNHEEHQILEAEAAKFFGRDASLFFPTGFAANLALFSTLPQRGDIVIHDELIHASVHDGLRLGRADYTSAPHNDPSDFEKEIQNWRKNGGTGRPWLAVESLYSMDGDLAPLAALLDIADRHDAFLIVDEAHAVGVYGDQGRGLAHHLGRRDNIITMAGCGKALGVEGGFLCGPSILIDFIINRGRPFIFSTAPSPMSAHLVRGALEICAGADERRKQLATYVAHLGQRLTKEMGVKASGSHIQPVIVGENGKTMQLAKTLQDAGFDVRGIRPPTVAEGSARLRLSVTLNVSPAEIDSMLDILSSHWA